MALPQDAVAPLVAAQHIFMAEAAIISQQQSGAGQRDQRVPWYQLTRLFFIEQLFNAVILKISTSWNVVLRLLGRNP